MSISPGQFLALIATSGRNVVSSCLGGAARNTAADVHTVRDAQPCEWMYLLRTYHLIGLLAFPSHETQRFHEYLIFPSTAADAATQYILLREKRSITITITTTTITILHSQYREYDPRSSCLD